MPPPKHDNNAKQGELIAALVPTRGQPLELTLIRGWVGEATTAKDWRVYTSMSLSQYFDVARESVYYVLAPDSTAVAEYIWLLADAKLRWTTLGEGERYSLDVPPADTPQFVGSYGVEPTQCPRPCRSV